jgi:hypothetical protein
MVFVFDQPMDTTVDWMPSFPPFAIGNFEWSLDTFSVVHEWDWSEDGRTLTAAYLFGEFPAGTLVMWTLNPGGGGDDPFVSESGVPLPETTGSFMTAGQSTGQEGDEDCDGFPDEWGSYAIFKGASYEQTSAADPLPAANAPYGFGAIVGAVEAGPELSEGSVTIPGAGEQELDPAPFTGDLFWFSTVPTEELWMSLFPEGSYTLRFTAVGESERVIAMDLPSEDFPTPKIANFGAAQSIDASQDFTLHWNEFTGAGDDGYLSVVITDETFDSEIVFQVPNYCVPIEIAPSATSVVIPADTLVADRVYQGILTFGRYGYLSTNDIPEMAGSCGVSKMTSFTLNTTTGGGAAIPATFNAVRILGNGNPEMSLTGTGGLDYRVERTGSMAAPNWVEVGVVTMDGTGSGVFEDTTAQSNFPLYYRAVTD